MKICITGATGELGKRVVTSLVSKNMAVVALSRSKRNEDLLKNIGAEARPANLFNAMEIEAATKDCDAILHLATHIPKKPSPRLKDWRMNDKIRIDGTRNLVKAVIKNDIQMFICQSVTALYGQQHGKYVSEIPFLPQTKIKMLESAMEMENIIKSQIGEQSVILRFGTFYSEDAYHTRELVTNIRKRKMPLFGKGDFYWNFIHTDDAADVMVFAVEHFQKLKGNQLDVTDFSPILSSDALIQLSALTNSKKPFSIQMFLARILLGKNAFRFLTNSYRIAKDPLLRDWQPKYPDFISGMKQILDQ